MNLKLIWVCFLIFFDILEIEMIFRKKFPNSRNKAVPEHAAKLNLFIFGRLRYITCKPKCDWNRAERINAKQSHRLPAHICTFRPKIIY